MILQIFHSLEKFEYFSAASLYIHTKYHQSYVIKVRVSLILHWVIQSWNLHCDSLVYCQKSRSLEDQHWPSSGEAGSWLATEDGPASASPSHPRSQPPPLSSIPGRMRGWLASARPVAGHDNWNSGSGIISQRNYHCYSSRNILRKKLIGWWCHVSDPAPSTISNIRGQQ